MHKGHWCFEVAAARDNPLSHSCYFYLNFIRVAAAYYGGTRDLPKSDARQVLISSAVNRLMVFVERTWHITFTRALRAITENPNLYE